MFNGTAPLPTGSDMLGWNLRLGDRAVPQITLCFYGLLYDEVMQSIAWLVLKVQTAGRPNMTHGPT